MANHEKLHIAMLPWLAFGHMIPFLEIAKFLARKGHRVSFLSTPRNIQRLLSLPRGLADQISFVELTLPATDGLPEHAEATSDLPYGKVQYLKKAYDDLAPQVAAFLEHVSPDWLLFDFATFWGPRVASNLGIPCVFFSIFTAAFLGFLGPTEVWLEERDDVQNIEMWTAKPKWVPFESTVCYRHFEIVRVMDGFNPNDSGVSDVYRLAMALKDSDILAVRDCYEYEPDWLKLVEDLNRKPVIPVGLLPQSLNDDPGDSTDTWRLMKYWLDKHPKGSVVYVAFGSEARLTQKELTELALGLEMSHLPFLWVLRIERRTEEDEVLDLPVGFEDRTKGRGLVWTSWAPQLRVLRHRSVGGFLTHSGWGSVVEAMQFGKPLLLLTFSSEQPVIAKVVEEKKMGYVIPRDEQDGWFTRDSVADSARLVVVEEEGKVYRNKAQEMSLLFGDRVKNEGYLEKFLEHLIQRGTKDKEDLRKLNKA